MKMSITLFLALSLFLHLSPNVHCSYNDESELEEVKLTRLGVNSLFRAYAHLQQLFTLYPQVYATILFTHFPQQFEDAFGNENDGSNCQLLTMLNDFDLLPNDYAVGIRGEPFDNLRAQWTTFTNQNEVGREIHRRGNQGPTSPRNVFVPQEFRAIMTPLGLNEELITMVEYRYVKSVFLNYVENYPLTSARTRPFIGNTEIAQKRMSLLKVLFYLLVLKPFFDMTEPLNPPFADPRPSLYLGSVSSKSSQENDSGPMPYHQPLTPFWVNLVRVPRPFSANQGRPHQLIYQDAAGNVAQGRGFLVENDQGETDAYVYQEEGEDENDNPLNQERIFSRAEFDFDVALAEADARTLAEGMANLEIGGNSPPQNSTKRKHPDHDDL